MHIEILKSCMSCGHCTLVNENVFEIKNNIVIVNSENIKGNEHDCRLAAEICPAGAIKIYE